MKYHHCLLDGVAGSGMAALLLDTEPSPAPREIPPIPRPGPEPSRGRLFVQSLVPSLAAPWRAVRYGLELTRRAVDVAGYYAAPDHAKPDVRAMAQAPRRTLTAGIPVRIAYESHLLSYVPGTMNALVAGPPGRRALAGAPLTGIFSASVILEGMGVNITVFSYDGRFDFGIHVDPDLVPDPRDLAAAVPEALAELMDATSLGPPAPVRDPFGLETD